jgi:hypothetical protein
MNLHILYIYLMSCLERLHSRGKLYELKTNWKNNCIDYTFKYLFFCIFFSHHQKNYKYLSVLKKIIS